MYAKIFKLATLLSLSVLFLFVSCEDDDKTEMLPPEEAKKEIRNASQSLADQINQMMSAPAMQVFDYFFFLIDEDPFDFKNPVESSIFYSPNKMFFGNEELKFGSYALNFNTKMFDPAEDKGVFEFDYDEQNFVLIDGDVDYLEIRFPASEDDFLNQNNNAVLRIDDIEIAVVDQEEIPLRLLMSLTVDEEELFMVDHNLEFDNNNEPVNGSLYLVMHPYTYEVEFTRTGTTNDAVITSTASIKLNGSIIMSYSLNAEGDMDKDAPDLIEGNILADLLKFEGVVYLLAIEEHFDKVEAEEVELDINYLNEKLDVEVIHTELDKTIGHLEFYHAGFVGDELVEDIDIIIVYKDGSWELLEDAMPELAEMFEAFMI